MAKKSVTESTFAKNPQGVYTVGQKSDLPASVVRMRAGPTVTRGLKGDIKAPPAMGPKRIGAVANKYGAPIGPMGRAGVPGGRGIMALNDVRLGPTAGAPKATVRTGKPAAMSAPIKTQVKPAETIRTVVAERLTPERKSTPMRGTNLGVSSGKTTGKTVSRGGTGGRTTGGGRATGGGYSNAGPAGMGASGRGTGGKR